MTNDAKKYFHVEYDFVSNDEGELMLVIDALKETADDENAKFVYDGNCEAMLIRNENSIIHLPVIEEEAGNLLKEIDTILVTEMEGEDIGDVYEAEVEIINKALPIPDEVRKGYKERKNEKNNPLFLDDCAVNRAMRGAGRMRG